MTATHGVARAAGKTDALRALVETGRMIGWDLALYDASGVRLAPAEDGGATLGDVGAAAVRAPVLALGEAVGHVAAVRVRDDAAAGQPFVDRVAAVMGDLCARELELLDLAREIAGAYEELNLFYDLTTALAGARDPAVVCGAVLERALRVAPARAARIVLRGERGSLRTVVARGENIGGSVVGTDSAAERCTSGSTTLLVDRDGGGGEGADELDAWEEAAERSLLAVPVRALSGDDVHAIGALELRDRMENDAGSLAPFTSGDCKVAQALADQAALLLENARLAAYERELQLACQIQESLLPERPPVVEGLDIAAACRPAHDVGGDYYDFLPLGMDEVEVVIADVSGHHLAAALLQTAARATFRAAALRGEGPARTLEIGNHALMADLSRSDHFLTAWIARIDAFGGEVVYESAGHPATLVYRAESGAVDALEGGGLPVGVLHRGGYRDRTTRLGTGDVMLLHTDGLFEARGADGSVFGAERLTRVFTAAARSGSAQEIVDAIVGAVERHAPRAGDDRTLVVLKRT